MNRGIACLLAGAVILYPGSAVAASPERLCSPGMLATLSNGLAHNYRGYYQGEGHHKACRELPTAAGHAVVALAVRNEAAAPRDRAVFDFDLLIVRADGTVARHLPVDDAHALDAHTLVGLAIDTGRYDLAPALRAFGVRSTLDSGYHQRRDSADKLTLYVDHGGELRPVLRRLMVAASAGIVHDACTLDIDKTTRTIALGTGVTNGMRDLVVKTRSTRTTKRRVDKSCDVTVGATRAATYTLRYDGREYPIPDALAYTPPDRDAQ